MAFIWLSGLRFIDREIFNGFFHDHTGDRKNNNIPGVNWLMHWEKWQDQKMQENPENDLIN